MAQIWASHGGFFRDREHACLNPDGHHVRRWMCAAFSLYHPHCYYHCCLLSFGCGRDQGRQRLKTLIQQAHSIGPLSVLHQSLGLGPRCEA